MTQLLSRATYFAVTLPITCQSAKAPDRPFEPGKSKGIFFITAFQRTTVIFERLEFVELSTIVYSQTAKRAYIRVMFKQSKLGA